MYSEMFAYAITFITFATAFYFYFRNRGEARRDYNAYYNEKRKQFPWLDGMINQRGKNIANIRAFEGANALRTALMFLAIALILGWVLVGAIQFLAYLYTIFFFDPFYKFSRPVAVILWISGLIIGYIVAFFIVKGRYYSTPPKVIECPECGCPHSWDLINKKNHVEKEYIEEITTTTTTTRSGGNANDYGGGFIGALFAGGGGSSTSRSRERRQVYEGTEITEYICNNCGHTATETKAETWYCNRPTEEIAYKNIGFTWTGGGEGILYKGIRLVIIIILGMMTIVFFNTALSQAGNIISSSKVTNGTLDYGFVTYEGEIVGGKANGRGKFTYKDGRICEGYFINDEFVGLPLLQDAPLYDAHTKKAGVIRTMNKGEFVIILKDKEPKNNRLPVRHMRADLREQKLKMMGWVDSEYVDRSIGPNAGFRESTFWDN